MCIGKARRRFISADHSVITLRQRERRAPTPY